MSRGAPTASLAVVATSLLPLGALSHSKSWLEASTAGGPTAAGDRPCLIYPPYCFLSCFQRFAMFLSA
jgi:hypothetical protein